MSTVTSPFHRTSLKASVALNVVLVVAMFVSFLPLGAAVANARYCILGLPLAVAPDVAQSGKIRSNAVAIIGDTPASVVRGSTPRTSGPETGQKVSFIRCLQRDGGLEG